VSLTWRFFFVFAGRHRWVDYADTENYNASSVPPEWHGWLHHITDHTAEQVLMTLQMFHHAFPDHSFCKKINPQVPDLK
jgi:NADH:ubiquinone oxidoreductase subunit